MEDKLKVVVGGVDISDGLKSVTMGGSENYPYLSAFPGHDRAGYEFVEAMLDHVGYKPLWTFEAQWSQVNRMVSVRIAAPAIDCVAWIDTGTQIHAHVQSNTTVPSHVLITRERERFIDWLRREIRALELHEMDEFFHDPATKKPYHDPHERDLP